MGTQLRQKPDGSVALANDSDGVEYARVGGPSFTQAAASTIGTPGDARWKTRKIIQYKFGTQSGVGVIGVACPEATDVLVCGAYVFIRTSNGAAATVDVGIASTATTSSNNLITALSLNQTGIFNNIDDKGASGKSRQLWTVGSTTSFLTASITTTLTSFVGDMLVEYLIP